METVFDLITLAIFGGLVVLFLQRSLDHPDGEPYKDSIWQYLIAGTGCAAANWLGNHGYNFLAVCLIVATLAYTTYVLKPFKDFPPR